MKVVIKVIERILIKYCLEMFLFSIIEEEGKRLKEAGEAAYKDNLNKHKEKTSS